jgi:hypothetical protein
MSRREQSCRGIGADESVHQVGTWTHIEESREELPVRLAESWIDLLEVEVNLQWDNGQHPKDKGDDKPLRSFTQKGRAVRLRSECQTANPEMVNMSGMPHKEKNATKMVAVTLGGSFLTPSGKGNVSKMRAV